MENASFGLRPDSLPGAEVIASDATANSSRGFLVSFVVTPSWANEGCSNGSKPRGCVIGPGVSARYGSAAGNGSATGVAKPSGRSTGAYAAPSFQLAMASF